MTAFLSYCSEGDEVFLLKNFRQIAYIILSVLVGVLLIAATVASFTGDNSLFTGDGTLASLWFPIALLGLYALVQIGCLALYHFGFNVYKIGFALLHVGILVMLVGFLAGAIGGERYFQTYVIGGAPDNEIYRESDSSPYLLDYYAGATGFTLERYDPDENGNRADKYYRVDMVFVEPSGEQENAYLEMNKTYRKEGLKYYLMSYSEGKYNGDGYPFFNLDAIKKSYEGQNYADIYGQITGDYPDAGSLTWHYGYQWMTQYSDSYMRYADYENCPAYAYVTEEKGVTDVYIYPKQVYLLIKRDPGEYAVLAGMGMTVLGTVMTCLLRRKKRSGPETDAAGRKGADA